MIVKLIDYKNDLLKRMEEIDLIVSSGVFFFFFFFCNSRMHLETNRMECNFMHKRRREYAKCSK